MTYLELVKELAAEAGTVSASQITTIESISEDHVEDLARWIAKSNMEIERLREDWRFRQREGEIEIEAGETDFSLPDRIPDEFFHKINFYTHPYRRNHIQIDDRDNRVDFVPYRQWTGDYDRRLENAENGRPHKFTVLPDERIRVYPRPDETHKLLFNYIRRPLTLERKDECEPQMPALFQNVIIYWALQKHVFFDENARRMQTVQFQLDQALMDLRNDQLPKAWWDAPTFRGGYGYGYR